MKYMYLVTYQYNHECNYCYKCFDNLKDAYSYYKFLKQNIDLFSLTLKIIYFKNEVMVCGS